MVSSDKEVAGSLVVFLGPSPTSCGQSLRPHWSGVTLPLVLKQFWHEHMWLDASCGPGGRALPV